MVRKNQRNSNNVLLRISKKLLALLLVIGIPALVFLLNFNIKNVEVAGTRRYTEDQIKSLVFQTKPDHNSLYLYLKYRFFTQPGLPFIEKLDVKMKDNHSVTIRVYEKMVAGCVEFMGEYLYFDKDGIIVESTSKQLEEIPLIKGLHFKEIILNEKLKVQKDELFDTILNLTQLIEKYGLKVQTISFASNYEITLSCEDVKVLLGNRDTYDEPLSDLKNILKEVEGTGLKKLDMRNYQKGTGYIIGN